MNSKKSILIFCTNSLKKQFIESMKLEGYNVIDFHDEEHFKIKTQPYDKYLNIFNRIIFKQKDYLINLRKKRFQRNSNKRIKEIIKDTSVDYTIFFRADIYELELIKKITKHSNYNVSYQCDGSNEISDKMNSYKKYFDRIFSFNPPDVKKYKFVFLTNCFFNTLFENKVSVNNTYKEIYYLGMWSPDRDKSIDNLNQFLNNSSYKLNAYFNIASYRNRKNYDGIEFHTQVLDYEDYIKKILKKDVIIDLVYQNHKGLSFRFFEALYFNKKIITNNYDVENYDFYNPNNIYICDFKNFNGLNDFLSSDYEMVDENILHKYSFSNWFKTILDHEKI